MVSRVACFLSCAVLAAASTPGTQTILLVKGGYGVGANLLARSSRTTHVFPVTPLPLPHGSEARALIAATKTSAELTQELQEAVRYASSSEGEKRAQHAQLSKLATEVAEEKRSLQGMTAIHSQNAALQKEVVQLKHELQAEQALESKEAKKDNALSSKVLELGRDLTVTNRAWRDAALKARKRANDLEKLIQGIKKEENVAKASSTPVVAKQHAVAAKKPVAAKQLSQPAAKSPNAKVEKAAPQVATPAKKKPVTVQKPKGVTAVAKAHVAKSQGDQDSSSAEDEAESEVDDEDEGESDSGDDTKQTVGKEVKDVSTSDADVDDQESDADVEADSDTDNF